MKAFTLFRFPVLVLCLGGALFLCPASKAQSEVSPDHFDGTDSWAVAAKAPVHKLVAAKPNPALSASRARNRKAGSAAPVEIAARQDASSPAQPNALVAREKSAAPPKQEKQ